MRLDSQIIIIFHCFTKILEKQVYVIKEQFIWNNVLKSGIPLDQSNMLFKQQLRKQIMSGSIRDKLH